jgi:hypothetical protein
MPRPFRYNEARRKEIGDAIVAARPDPLLSPRNRPWKLLERDFGYTRTRLWQLWKEALANK